MIVGNSPVKVGHRQTPYSRPAVHKTPSNLEGVFYCVGFCGFAVRGRGYLMSEAGEWLDGEVVAHLLGTAAGHYSIHVLDSVDSTNTALMAAALDGAADGTLFSAELNYSGW